MKNCGRKVKITNGKAKVALVNSIHPWTLGRRETKIKKEVVVLPIGKASSKLAAGSIIVRWRERTATGNSPILWESCHQTINFFTEASVEERVSTIRKTGGLKVCRLATVMTLRFRFWT